MIFFFILYSEDKPYFYLINDQLFYSNIDFSYIKSKTNYLRGKLVHHYPSFVSASKFIYKDVNTFNNSYVFTCDENLVINNFYSGVVIFKGEKENLGNTLIIAGDNNIYYWYSNIENIPVNLYDYIEKGTIIGSVIDSKLILTLTKDGNYLSYEGLI